MLVIEQTAGVQRHRIAGHQAGKRHGTGVQRGAGVAVIHLVASGHAADRQRLGRDIGRAGGCRVERVVARIGAADADAAHIDRFTVRHILVKECGCRIAQRQHIAAKPVVVQRHAGCRAAVIHLACACGGHRQRFLTYSQVTAEAACEIERVAQAIGDGMAAGGQVTAGRARAIIAKYRSVAILSASCSRRRRCYDIAISGVDCRRRHVQRRAFAVNRIETGRQRCSVIGAGLVAEVTEAAAA